MCRVVIHHDHCFCGFFASRKAITRSGILLVNAFSADAQSGRKFFAEASCGLNVNFERWIPCETDVGDSSFDA